MAWSIQRGRGQLPIPITERGSITGMGEDADGRTFLSAMGLTATVLTSPEVLAVLSRTCRGPLLTRNFNCFPSLMAVSKSFPVMRHQAGRSSSTEISVERI